MCVFQYSMFNTIYSEPFHKSRRFFEYGIARTPFIKRVYWKYAPSYYRWQLKKQLDHGVPLDPLKIVNVDPDKVSRMSARPGRLKNRYQDIGSVKSGEWDQHSPKSVGNWDDNVYGLFTAETVEQTVLYTSMYEHFKNGVPWENTKIFVLMAEIIENRGGIRDMKTQNDIGKKFKMLDNLYSDIDKNGYRTQLELNRRQLDSGRVGYLDVLTDEITVDIGRNGELLFVDGRHRLCIAKILGLSEIPIVFLVRHSQWMEQRESLRSTHNGNELLKHPDLVEFDPKNHSNYKLTL